MRENVKINQQDNESLAVKMLSGDIPNIKMTGYCIDRIYKDGVLVEEIEGHNLVVNSFVNLIMCMLKQQNGYSGIQYWAIGSGAPSWDNTMPTPDITATKLTAEIGRMPIDPNKIVFLDSEYNVVSTPTNIIQISHTFGESECNGTWREFGIFGGNATSTANSGIMINKRHHAVLTKTEGMSVERVMRFTLSLV